MTASGSIALGCLADDYTGGTDVAAAADAVEELEETARLHLLLQGHRTRPLTPEQAAGLRNPTPRGAAR